MARGSPKTVAASWNVTSCFLRFAAAFFESHSNLIIAAFLSTIVPELACNHYHLGLPTVEFSENRSLCCFHCKILLIIRFLLILFLMLFLSFAFQAAFVVSRDIWLLS